MAHYQSIRRQKSTQRGITLFEALIALVILALGILGLAAVQARMAVESRTTDSRALAIQLIADLGERVRLNKGALPSNYSDSTPNTFTAPAANLPAGGCDRTVATTNATACSPAAQAITDLWTWRTLVANSLMGGLANVRLVTGTQQLQVIVAWQLNENTNITVNGTPNTQLAAPLGITPDAACDTGGTYICHVDFIDFPPP